MVRLHMYGERFSGRILHAGSMEDLRRSLVSDSDFSSVFRFQ